MGILCPFFTFTCPIWVYTFSYKAFVVSCVLSNRTFIIFGFFFIQNKIRTSSRIYLWDLYGTLIPVNYPERSITGLVLNIVIINILCTILHKVQINIVSNESNIKPIFSSFLYHLGNITYFYINGTTMGPLGPFEPIYILYRTHIAIRPPT